MAQRQLLDALLNRAETTLPEDELARKAEFFLRGVRTGRYKLGEAEEGPVFTRAGEENNGMTQVVLVPKATTLKLGLPPKYEAFALLADGRKVRFGDAETRELEGELVRRREYLHPREISMRTVEQTFSSHLRDALCMEELATGWAIEYDLQNLEQKQQVDQKELVRPIIKELLSQRFLIIRQKHPGMIENLAKKINQDAENKRFSVVDSLFTAAATLQPEDYALRDLRNNRTITLPAEYRYRRLLNSALSPFRITFYGDTIKMPVRLKRGYTEGYFITRGKLNGGLIAHLVEYFGTGRLLLRPAEETGTGRVRRVDLRSVETAIGWIPEYVPCPLDETATVMESRLARGFKQKEI